MFLLWLTLLKNEREFTTSRISIANSMNCLYWTYKKNKEIAQAFCNSYVWTWALHAVRRFLKANRTCEIQLVLFTRTTEVAPVVPNIFTLSWNTAVTAAELWWYVNSFSRNRNKSFRNLLFFSITVFVESCNLCDMQWELNINLFAASLIFLCTPFCLHHRALGLSSMAKLSYHQLYENFLHWFVNFKFKICALWIGSQRT